MRFKLYGVDGGGERIVEGEFERRLSSVKLG